MANTDYKSTDALMRHLRNNGISISGSSEKQQLINTGYFLMAIKDIVSLYHPQIVFHTAHIMRLTQQ
ncbi:MAG: hypothetical protein PUB98_05815 [Clostridiales bacterium]|nr:hypothetical protein [Clostridiales bacterium]